MPVTDFLLCAHALCLLSCAPPIYFTFALLVSWRFASLFSFFYIRMHGFVEIVESRPRPRCLAECSV